MNQQCFCSIQMPLDGFMETGFFTELGQPFCSRISGNPSKIVNKYQAKDMTSYVRRRIPDGMSYPCKRRRRNAIAHVVMSSIISSSLASQELHASFDYIGAKIIDKNYSVANKKAQLVSSSQHK